MLYIYIYYTFYQMEREHCVRSKTINLVKPTGVSMKFFFKKCHFIIEKYGILLHSVAQLVHNRICGNHDGTTHWPYPRPVTIICSSLELLHAFFNLAE
jgi:hypothetical protein